MYIPTALTMALIYFNNMIILNVMLGMLGIVYMPILTIDDCTSARNYNLF